MFRSYMIFRHACLLVGICLVAILVVGTPTHAGVDDYGVMWSFQTPDGNDGAPEQASNYYNGGGHANGYTYISSWQHSNTWPPSSSGGRGFFSAGVDHWGVMSPNYQFAHVQSPPNAVGLAGQAYGFGFAVRDIDGKTNIALAGAMQSADNWETNSTTGADGAFSAYLSGWNDVEGANTEAVREHLIYQTAGGTTATNYVWAFGAHIDSAGNYYMTGPAQTSFSDGVTNITHPDSGERDLFVAKFDSSGALTGGVIDDMDAAIAAPSMQRGFGVTVDEATGDIYVVGRTYADILGDGFGSGTSTSNPPPYYDGNYDGFAAKYDSSFNQQWVVEVQTTETDHLFGVQTDTNGDVYVAGRKNNNAYIAKLDKTDGSTIWEEEVSNGTALDIMVDGNQVVLIGGTADDLTGDGIEGVVDNFLRRYDAATGTVVDTKQFGTADADYAQSVDLLLNGEIMFLTGQTRGDYPDFTRADLSLTHNQLAAVAIKYTVGDLNDDDLTNWDDMKVIMDALAGGDLTGDTTYDFDGDGNSTQDDVTYFMEEIFESEFGDFDFDGAIDQDDYDLLDGVLGTDWKKGDPGVDLAVGTWRGFTGPLTPGVIDFEEWDYLYDATVGTAVPEPSTLLLMALGCLGGLAFRRRRMKNLS